MADLRILRLPASPVEHSPAGRAFVLAGFVIAAAAVVWYGQDYVLPGVCVAVAAAGHWISYSGRNKPRTFTGQALIAGLVFACLGYFLADSVAALFGGVLPQANFALLLVAVTSFDLKTRRNCYSSLWISLAILYLAAVYAWDYQFGVVVALWAGCLGGFWASSHLRRLGARLSAPPAGVAGLAAGALLMGLVAFVLIPQPSGDPTGPLVVSLPSYAQFRGELESPALPLVQLTGDASGSVDLHYRGRLGDSVVMYVRTGAPAYWRGLVFDTYVNGSWTAVQPAEPVIYPPYVPARLLPPGPESSLGTFVQTFRVMRTMPGVIDAASPIASLYVPVAQLRRDAYGTFRTPDVLRAGTTYSVVSYIPDLSPQRLRADTSDALPPPGLAPYLEHPSDPRLAGLAQHIAGGQATEYDRVMALTNYLQKTYAYTLQLGHVPAGVDPVDWFLFDAGKGYCEQFATALAMMLRTLGIPTRLATGYSTGEYDPVLDQSIVREKDAHAWVEAWFPIDGWVPVDPTPTFPALPATQFPNHWAGAGIARLLPHLSIGAAPAVLASVGFLGVVPPAIAIAVVIVLLYAWLRRVRVRRRLRGRAPPGSSELLDLYDRLQKRAGRRRAPPETPLEYWTVMPGEPLLEEVTHAVNEGAYAGRWPDRARVRELAEKLS